MSGQQERLQLALDAALHRYEDRVGAAFPADVELDVISSEVFYAAVYPGTDGIVVEVSTGAVDTIEETWRAALAVSKDMPEGSGIDPLGDPEHPIDMSLRWLMQHELNHYAIGHFALSGGAGLLEAELPSQNRNRCLRRTRPSLLS